MANDGHARFQVLVGHRSRVVEAAHAAVHKIKAHKAGVFEVGVVLVVEIGKFALDILDVAKEPVHDVNEVAKLGKERAAVEVFGAFPAARFVVAFVAVPVAVELHHVDVAQHLAVNEVFDPYRWRRVAVLHDAKYLLRHLQGFVDNGFAAFGAEAHWFFAHHMFLGFEGQKCLVGMQPVGCTHIDDIEVQAAGQEVFDVVEKRDIEILGAAGFFAAGVYQCYKLAFCIAADHFGMAFTDVSGADYCKFYFTHVFCLLIRLLIGIVGRFRGKWRARRCQIASGAHIQTSSQFDALGCRPQAHRRVRVW